MEYEAEPTTLEAEPTTLEAEPTTLKVEPTTLKMKRNHSQWYEEKKKQEGYVPLGWAVPCNESSDCGPLAICFKCRYYKEDCIIKKPYCVCKVGLPLLENRTCVTSEDLGLEPWQTPIFDSQALKSEGERALGPTVYFWLVAVPIVFVFLGIYVYFKKRSSSRGILMKQKRMAQMKAQLL